MNNIEILENIIQCFKQLQNTLDDDEKELFEYGIQQKEVESIENLIQENKELKDTNMKMSVNGGSIRAKYYIEENYIPKSKVLEKIKIRKEEKAESKDSIEAGQILREIYVLEELL